MGTSVLFTDSCQNLGLNLMQREHVCVYVCVCVCDCVCVCVKEERGQIWRDRKRNSVSLTDKYKQPVRQLTQETDS